MIELIASLVIDLSDQRLYAYAPTGDVLYAAPVSTGKASTPTPTGNFFVFGKYPRTDLVGADYRVNLPYVMCLDGDTVLPDRYCIHPNPYPEQQLGKPASHGCIRTSLDTARWLFNRVSLKTPVYIQE